MEKRGRKMGREMTETQEGEVREGWGGRESKVNKGEKKEGKDGLNYAILCHPAQ